MGSGSGSGSGGIGIEGVRPCDFVGMFVPEIPSYGRSA